MFTQRRYTRKAELAIPIQKLWKRGARDFRYTILKLDNEEIDIWVPRQDDLQEIYLDVYSDYVYACTKRLISMMEQFELFCRQKVWWGDDLCPDISLEELWLDFVMLKKFGFVWDSDKKDWISI